MVLPKQPRRRSGCWVGLGSDARRMFNGSVRGRPAGRTYPPGSVCSPIGSSLRSNFFGPLCLVPIVARHCVPRSATLRGLYTARLVVLGGPHCHIGGGTAEGAYAIQPRLPHNQRPMVCVGRAPGEFPSTRPACRTPGPDPPHGSRPLGASQAVDFYPRSTFPRSP